jgi:hypothetical protein
VAVARLGDDFVDRLRRRLDARIAELAQDAERLERARRALGAHRPARIDARARLNGDGATSGAGAASAQATPASREAQHTPTSDVGGQSTGVSRAVVALRAELDASLRGGR